MASRIEKILWARKNANFPDFIKIHKTDLPKVVLVKQSPNLLLERDQVLCIAKVTSQVRFIATDSEGRRYSIPNDYPIKVQLFHKGNYTEEQELTEVCRKFPVVVKFVTEPPHLFQWSADGDRIPLSKLTIVRKCEQEFALVYKITNGMVDGCVVAMPTSENVLLGVAQGFGTSDVLKADWLACVKVLGTILEEFKDVPTCLSEIMAVSEKGLTDTTRTLIPLPRASNVVYYPQIKLVDKLPPDPAPSRPHKPVKQIRIYIELHWPKKEHTLKEFFETFCDDLPQIVMVCSGVWGLTDIETFGGGEMFRIQTYSRQTRVIAMDPMEKYMSIPVTYKVKMKVIESPGKYSKPLTLEEIVNNYTLPVKVRLPDDGANFTNKSDDSAYEMNELELQDTYKETYFLCNAVFSEGDLNKHVVVMPIYIDITVQVADGYEDKPEEEWVEYNKSLDKIASELNFNVPTPNKNIAVFSPGQVNVGENIYEYIVPNSFLTLSSEREEVDGTDYELPPDTPSRTGAYAVPLNSKPGQNEYHKHVSKPGVAVKKSTKGAPGPISISALIAPSATNQPKRNERPRLPSPVSIVSPGPVSPPPRPSKPTGASANQLPTKEGKQAIVSPFQYNPGKQDISAGKPPTKVSHQKPVSSKSSRTPLTEIGDIPPDVSGLSVEEVCDCMKLLNLAEFVDAARKLQIDGFLLKEFSSEDYQNDTNFKMSVTQSKMLVRFAKGWRPRHS